MHRLRRGEASRAQNHALLERQSNRQGYDPVGRHADVLRPATPLASAQFVARDHNLLAGLKLAARALGNNSGRIDAGHVRQLADDARMGAGGEGVLVVQRRAVNPHQHIARRQVVYRALRQAAADVAVFVLLDQKAGQRGGVHMSLDRVSKRSVFRRGLWPVCSFGCRRFAS